MRKREWRLSAADIEAAYARQPFDGLLFASPANPTGAGVTRAGLAEIVATCRRLEVRLISDEIYHGLDYRGPSVSAREFGDDAIVINSFSKYYCMTGWRIGWMVLPEALLRRTEMLQQNLFISAPTLSQIAGLAALGERDYAEEQKAHYAANRLVLSDGLSALRFGYVAPADGAFYGYADASRLHQRYRRLLQDAARDGRRGDHARRRFRPPQRPPLHPFLLCRLAPDHRPGAAADGRISSGHPEAQRGLSAIVNTRSR